MPSPAGHASDHQPGRHCRHPAQTVQPGLAPRDHQMGDAQTRRNRFRITFAQCAAQRLALRGHGGEPYGGVRIFGEPGLDPRVSFLAQPCIEPALQIILAHRQRVAIHCHFTLRS